MSCRAGGMSAVTVGFLAAATWAMATSARAEGFRPTGSLYWYRASAASVSLPDGSVLVASESSIERYDPAQGVFFLVAYLSVKVAPPTRCIFYSCHWAANLETFLD